MAEHGPTDYAFLAAWFAASPFVAAGILRLMLWLCQWDAERRQADEWYD